MTIKGATHLTTIVEATKYNIYDVAIFCENGITSMPYSNSETDGKSFYQSEPLIARLRGIIRDYPEGVGIIKELI